MPARGEKTPSLPYLQSMSGRDTKVIVLEQLGSGARRPRKIT